MGNAKDLRSEPIWVWTTIKHPEEIFSLWCYSKNNIYFLQLFIV